MLHGFDPQQIRHLSLSTHSSYNFDMTSTIGWGTLFRVSFVAWYKALPLYNVMYIFLWGDSWGFLAISLCASRSSCNSSILSLRCFNYSSSDEPVCCNLFRVVCLARIFSANCAHVSQQLSFYVQIATSINAFKPIRFGAIWARFTIFLLSPVELSNYRVSEQVVAMIITVSKVSILSER